VCTVDGVPIGGLPKLFLDPGQHELAASHPDYQPARDPRLQRRPRHDHRARARPHRERRAPSAVALQRRGRAGERRSYAPELALGLIGLAGVAAGIGLVVGGGAAHADAGDLRAALQAESGRSQA
jgi:hypothetical protein